MRVLADSISTTTLDFRSPRITRSHYCPTDRTLRGALKVTEEMEMPRHDDLPEHDAVFGESSYVIKLNHKKGKPPIYLGAVPRATDHDDDQVLALERKGLRVHDFEVTLFKTLEEAARQRTSDQCAKNQSLEPPLPSQ